jgi:O-antigen/teichoic acid export membrane protein
LATQQLRARTFAAAGWTTFGTVGAQAIGFVVSIALTRLLTAADFGMLAMITVVSGFARVLSDVGLSAALIQARDVRDEEYSSAFWANFLIGLALTAMLAGAAPLLAWFYREQALTPYAIALSAQFSISALSTVHTTRLQQRLDFRPIVVAEVVSLLVASAAALVAAGSGWGTWSLVLRANVQSLCFLVLICRAERWLPSWHLSWHELRRFARFSLNLSGSRMLNYWIRNLDNLLIARFFGATDVGLYVRGYSVLMQPVSLVTAALGRVMFPAFSALKDDLERTRDVYRRTLQLIAFVTFPTMALLFVNADDFVLGLFGPDWVRCVPLVRIFSVLGALQSLGSTAGWIFQARGRADLQLYWSVLAGVVMVLCIVCGVMLGSVEYVALCTAIGSGGILLIPAFEVPGRLIGVAFLRVVSFVLGTLLRQALAPGLVRLMCCWLLGGATYLALARLSRQSALSEITAQLSRVLARKLK